MSNRDGILDSHPSERVKMPPELAAFDRWDADPNDLAKWEAAMAALAPGGYVNRCVNDIRRRPSQPLIQWRFHPHTVHRGRRLRSTQGPSDA